MLNILLAGFAYGIYQANASSSTTPFTTVPDGAYHGNMGGRLQSTVNVEDGDLVTLRCRGTGLYLRAASADQGYVISQVQPPNSWEMFRVRSVGGSTSKFSLQTYHGKYLTATDSYQSWAITGTADAVNGWEEMSFEAATLPASSWFYLHTYHGKNVRVDPESSKVVQDTKKDNHEIWEVVKVVETPRNWKAYMNGVNLGGWLVLENWITDSLMEGEVDEWGLVRRKGGPSSATAKTMMHAHWDSFFTESDIEQLHLYGITHIRIPIGWWIVDHVAADGFVDGGWAYLERALTWIGQRGMYAVLDLHAMPGAQTPYQSFTGHSQDRAYFFEDPANTARGRKVVLELARRIRALEASSDYRLQHVVMGIEFVNEPSNAHWDQTMAFYEPLVGEVRGLLDSARYCIFLSFMNSARDAATWMREQMLIDPANWENVVLDRHLYHAYGDDDIPPWAPWLPKPEWRDDMDACKTCCRDVLTLQPISDKELPVVFGEWALNTATVNEGNEKSSRFLQDYFGMQLSLWRHAATLGLKPYNPRSRGHFFWTAKIHVQADDYFINFDLLKLIKNSIIKDNINTFDVSSICPSVDRSRCPQYNASTVEWDSDCDFN